MTKPNFPGLGRMLSLAAALALAGCAGLEKPPLDFQPAMMTRIDQHNMRLRSMPPPVTRVRVAVYDFPDLTGQYRERENVQTLSRAVSQGGAPMLIQALQDTAEGRWFSVLDRAGLDGLLR